MAQMPLLTSFFVYWVGLEFVVRRFHNNTYMFSNHPVSKPAMAISSPHPPITPPSSRKVCDCGHGATSAVPVVDGFVLNRAVQRGVRGGEWLTHQTYAYLKASLFAPPACIAVRVCCTQGLFW